MNNIKLATVFSGIGAIEQACNKTKLKYDIVFACDNGERYVEYNPNIDNTCSNEELRKLTKEEYSKCKKTNFVKKTYFKNYKINEKQWFEDIRYINGNEFKGNVDLFVGGSPCQSFSIIGKRAGLEDTRGTLFYDFARLVKQMQPKVFIFENVLGMLTHEKGKTWKIINEVFISLGYKIFGPEILNSLDFGIPQKRKRIFVVGFKNKDIDFSFPEGKKKVQPINSFLDKGTVPTRYYLGKKGFEFVTNPKYKNRARVDSKIIQTQKANQQYNWNGDFIFQKLDEVKDNKDIMQRAYVGKFNGEQGVIRQMTPRECTRLMGFPKNFKLIDHVQQSYRQAGNSIVVDVLEAILKQIIETGVFNEED